MKTASGEKKRTGRINGQKLCTFIDNDNDNDLMIMTLWQRGEFIFSPGEGVGRWAGRVNGSDGMHRGCKSRQISVFVRDTLPSLNNINNNNNNNNNYNNNNNNNYIF